MLAKKIALAVGSILAFFLLIEGIVRLTDVDRRLLRLPFQKGVIPQVWVVPDPYLQWRNRPGAPLIWSSERFNARGFRGPDAAREKRPGVTRIGVVGDSCTMGLLRTGRQSVETPTPYPAILQALLDRNLGAGRFEVINYGVVGYTSYHGLRLLRREVLDAHPDFVVIRFGWNDLLASPLGRSFENPWSPFLESLEERIYRSRVLGPILYRVLVESRARQQAVRGSPTPTPWVTPQDYAWNLSRMIDLTREHGARPILLDAPAAPVTAEIRGYTDFLQMSGYDSIGHLLQAHARYQAITARVAERKAVPFIRTDAPASPADAGPLWSRHELIHPAAGGHDRIARILYKEIATLAARPGAP
jgi:lysophospholipase L1-like esterase